MDNYEIADEIRSHQKKARKLNSAAIALWLVASGCIGGACVCKVREMYHLCSAKKKYNDLDI